MPRARYTYRDVAHLVGGDRVVIDAIAEAADADPRTVVRVLRAEPVRPSTARRIVRAAIALGYPLPLSADAQETTR